MLESELANRPAASQRYRCVRNDASSRCGTVLKLNIRNSPSRSRNTEIAELIITPAMLNIRWSSTPNACARQMAVGVAEVNTATFPSGLASTSFVKAVK